MIGGIGIGINSAGAVRPLLERFDFDVVLLAGRYTLLDHEEALKDALPMCQTRGVSVVVGGAFNSGILATGLVPGAKYNYDAVPAEITERVKELVSVCEVYGVELAVPRFGSPWVMRPSPPSSRAQPTRTKCAKTRSVRPPNPRRLLG